MISRIKSSISQKTKRTLHLAQRRLAYSKELALGGSDLRESILVKLLGQYYASKFRREWQLSEEEPHFFSQRMGLFEFAFGENGHGPYPFYRGFFASELLQIGDRLLDIGCGDGFFTKRFFSERCAHIDAVDIEPSAIDEAVAYNSAPNITYHQLDAVNQPFPGDNYDVVVWDGALGHFAADTTSHMLSKIRQQLASGGVFVGSESLGLEGSDHLQFFHSLEDLSLIFKPHFEHVMLRSIHYRIGLGDGFLRHEAYWRCHNESPRLQDSAWQVY